MRLRKLLSLNLIWLAASILLFYFFFTSLITTYDKHPTLILHEGVLEDKTDILEPKTENEHTRIRLKLAGDTTWYTASSYYHHINDRVFTGDTVMIYTKPITSAWGNTVIDELAGQSWTTKDPNEIFQFVAKKDNDMIMSYKAYQQRGKPFVWLKLFIALVLLAFYLYKLSGKKSRFILET
jgi:hypothetical protein